MNSNSGYTHTSTRTQKEDTQRYIVDIDGIRMGGWNEERKEMGVENCI